ncbi:MAG: NAD(P)-dependent glycerol-3-phosphate dehydrogenase [Deltaproteobacteria bacterium]|nr:NAD(P)-dependent glycerol-3-phosphate dehydrogenase [Deltaproteobacteria bacterium]MBW2541201.1 NAD(P)-dependent glycerol-3-phosphate dehydrogenase [Deltaproteobacteria bacterium]
MGAVSIPIAVLGAGSFGTCLALLCARNHDVTIWAHDPDLAASINRDRKNPRYLTDLEIPANARATSDLAEALRDRELVICAIPSQFVRDVMTRANRELADTSILISTVKGIEKRTCMLMDEVFRDVLDPVHHPRLTFLSGPSFAREVADGQPTAVTVACRDETFAVSVQESLSTPEFRCYTGSDVVGVELAGALKNVIAIAVGVCDALGFGLNARAAVMTRGLREITRLGIAMGADPETFLGLAGTGDLWLTCTGDLSRNRRVGLALGRGERLSDIVSGMNEVAEGVRTTEGACELGRRHGVELPIAAMVDELIRGKITPEEGARRLMSRQLRSENE